MLNSLQCNWFAQLVFFVWRLRTKKVGLSMGKPTTLTGCLLMTSSTILFFTSISTFQVTVPKIIYHMLRGACSPPCISKTTVHTTTESNL